MNTSNTLWHHDTHSRKIAHGDLVALLGADMLEGDKFLQKADEKFEQGAARGQEVYGKEMVEARTSA